MKIYLDCDGTFIEHAWPNFGHPVPLALETIHKLQNAGHIIILNTYRSNISKDALQQTIDYLECNNVTIQSVTSKKYHPDMWNWDLIKEKQIMWIDDIAFNIPLIPNIVLTRGNMVDWKTLDKQFIEHKIY